MNRFYQVKPRYSGGSPAQVDAQTARNVARDEQQFHAMILEGIYGLKRTHEAKHLGLRGIVEYLEEHPDCYIVTDVLTDEKFIRMFNWRLAELINNPLALLNRRLKLSKKYNLPMEPEPVVVPPFVGDMADEVRIINV